MHRSRAPFQKLRYQQKEKDLQKDTSKGGKGQ
jgi:hypothetical protein